MSAPDAHPGREVTDHGHDEPQVAWRETYLYDETCGCGCPLLSCPDCGSARCLHCQPLCAGDLVRDRAARAIHEFDAIARDCFGADKPEAALAAVNKAAGARLVLSFFETSIRA